MKAPKIRCTYGKLVAIGKLRPNPENPNKHPEDQLKLYAKILMHQGWRRAVVVSKKSGLIVTGHGAYQTAKREGWPSCPVDFQDFASKADEVAHMIADNKLAQAAELDDAELAKLIKDELDGADLDLTGIDLAGLNGIGAVEPGKKDELIPDSNEAIDEAAMTQTENECPKCAFKW